MEISILLLKQIAELFLIVGMGVLLVRTKLLKKEESRGLSVVILYLVIPCAIIHAFHVDYTEEIRNGLILSFVVAIAIHAIMLTANGLFARLLHLDTIEQASVIYTNCGNLIIPIVTSVLGPEWIIYSCGFMCVQILLIWSHGRMLLCGEKKIDFKKILLNVNMIAAVVGLLLFMLQIKLPKMLDQAMGSVAGMVGPISMVVAGILIGSMSRKQILAYKRTGLVLLLRMFAIPGLVLAFLKLSHLEQLHPEGYTILLISFLATITPSASSVMQMAQIYGRDAEYASVINVVTTVVCIATMPLMVMLY